MRILLLAALILFIFGLVCLIAPTTIAGADWQVWLISGLIAWALDTLLEGRVKVG